MKNVHENVDEIDTRAFQGFGQAKFSDGAVVQF
jgi:hypothetical protein